MQTLVAGLGLATICTSPLARAVETAHLLNEAAGCKLRLVDALKDCCGGAGECGVGRARFEDCKTGRSVAGVGPSTPPA